MSVGACLVSTVSSHRPFQRPSSSRTSRGATEDSDRLNTALEHMNPRANDSRSLWFRQWDFWGWRDVPDYSSLVSLSAPHCSPATQLEIGQVAWRASTKRIARNEHLRWACSFPKPPFGGCCSPFSRSVTCFCAGIG